MLLRSESAIRVILNFIFSLDNPNISFVAKVIVYPYVCMGEVSF